MEWHQIVLCRKGEKFEAQQGWIKSSSLFHKNNHFLDICVISLQKSRIFEHTLIEFWSHHQRKGFVGTCKRKKYEFKLKSVFLLFSWKVIHCWMSQLKWSYQIRIYLKFWFWNVPSYKPSSQPKSCHEFWLFHPDLCSHPSPKLSLNFGYFNPIWPIILQTVFFFHQFNVPYGFCRY